MSQFPDPLVPAEVDLRDFQYMELDVQSLRDSRFAAEVDAEAFRAGVLLWCASWHQVPAASLPDNDVELSNLAGFGRVVKEWRKVREQALALFVRCSDGRLYHRLIAAKAMAAWKAKLHHHYDRARDRLRKANKDRAAEGLPALPQLSFDEWNANRMAGGLPMERADASAGIPQNDPPPSAGIPPENALKGKGTERRGNGEGTDYVLSSAPDGADGKPSSATPPDVPTPEPPAGATPEQPPAPPKSPEELTKAELWSAGKSLLESAGLPKRQCGSFIGKLVKSYGDAIVVEAVRAAVVARPADAMEYLMGACRRSHDERASAARASAFEGMV